MTSNQPSPTTLESKLVVQRQLDAYNARDLDAWAATYSDDAEQFLLHGATLAKGRAAIRARMAERFNDPRLHARLVHRIAMENTVMDHEQVTRTLPEGVVEVEMICLYEVSSGQITKATFAFGQARPLGG